MSWILEIDRVSIAYRTRRGRLHAVHDASLNIRKGESVAIIGESGCGKTTLATSIVRMLPLNAVQHHGRIVYRNKKGKELRLDTLSERHMRSLRWKDIVMMFQASQSSFNPVVKIQSQFLDTARAHGLAASREDVLRRSRELLEFVYLDGSAVLNAYPHELSGGMKQRTLIALGLLLQPQLIILDEPTTALDLITQKKILMLLNEFRTQYEFSMVFITHDLGIVTQLADRVVTMYAGMVVEDAPAEVFFTEPKHPYSRGLLRAVPKLTATFTQLYSIPGSTPDLVKKISGCLFAPRCEFVHDRCLHEVPKLLFVDEARKAACHLFASEGGPCEPR